MEVKDVEGELVRWTLPRVVCCETGNIRLPISVRVSVSWAEMDATGGVKTPRMVKREDLNESRWFGGLKNGGEREWTKRGKLWMILYVYHCADCLYGKMWSIEPSYCNAEGRSKNQGLCKGKMGKSISLPVGERVTHIRTGTCRKEIMGLCVVCRRWAKMHCMNLRRGLYNANGTCWTKTSVC